MIPTLVLNDLFDFDEDYVYEQIQRTDLDAGISGRVGGIRYNKTANGKELLAWQCNLVSVQGFTVKLPTIIHIYIDESNNIKSITLNDRFKGSQGIVCSWKYLNRHMQDTLISTGFTPQNPLITDPLILNCRHTFELVLGSSSFAAHCERLGADDAFISESTIAYANDETDSIELVDRMCLNGNDVVTKMSVCNYLNAINYNSSGSVESCNDLRITGYSYENNEYTSIGTEKAIFADSSNIYIMKVLKAIAKSWISSCKRSGVQKDFYFSQIWPPTSFGLLTQAFSLNIFKDNYTYFQHSVSGIQRVGDKPLCVGVIHSIEEGVNAFESFREEDLV